MLGPASRFGGAFGLRFDPSARKTLETPASSGEIEARGESVESQRISLLAARCKYLLAFMNVGSHPRLILLWNWGCVLRVSTRKK